MQIKIKAKNICFYCKKKIKAGEEIGIYKSGLVIHAEPCKREFDKLKEADKKDV